MPTSVVLLLCTHLLEISFYSWETDGDDRDQIPCQKKPRGFEAAVLLRAVLTIGILEVRIIMHP